MVYNCGSNELTRPYSPLCLKTGYACKASHCEKVEERLRNVKYDGRLAYNHLKGGKGVSMIDRVL